MARPVIVLKIGGSVLTGLTAYGSVARALVAQHLARPDERLLAVVSAEAGATDALEALASTVAPVPDAAALDLLWSTGEMRSVALLTLALRGACMRAVGLGMHQVGIHVDGDDDSRPCIRVEPRALLHHLALHDIVVVPGFVGIDRGGALVSLGRGGSDLTAVLLAGALDAARCELVKDIGGYFTEDPHLHQGLRRSRR